jgi:NADPH-dependent 2,4-dienoyl-CoA reductase/sulfur reductase-like enzyme/rhodanese-related sulfurtransferase
MAGTGPNKRIVVIGGVAGGASFAARMRRLDEHADIILLEKTGHVSFANCGLPYYLGREIRHWQSLIVADAALLRKRFNLDVRIHTEATAINRDAKTVSIKDHKSGATEDLKYDELVLAVGCEALMPPIPGIQRDGHFPLRTLDDTQNIEVWMARTHPQTVVVCGGGFIGLEIAEQLRLNDPERKIRSDKDTYKLKVHVVEAMDQVMAPLDRDMAEYLHEKLEENGIDLHLSDPVASFDDAVSSSASCIKLKSGKVIHADLVILAMGVRPSTKWIGEAGITLAPRGHIKVNEKMQTNDINIWAVGDAVEVHNAALGGDAQWAVALGGPANRQGRICADFVHGLPSAKPYRGTYGASVVKIFELTAAGVGVNERFLKGSGLPFKTVELHPWQHASYFPGRKSIHLKVHFNHEDGRIYGAQAVGEEGVEKRIDAVSAAMMGGLTAGDLADLELTYAPPYNSARDPLNHAGMMAQNIMAGLVRFCDVKDAIELEALGEPFVLLDLRESHHLRMGPHQLFSDKQVVVSQENIREELPGLETAGKLTKDMNIVLSCRTGARAHSVYRILVQVGYNPEKLCVMAGSWYSERCMLKFLKKDEIRAGTCER